MAKARSPNRDKAFNMWQESDGKISNREIAAQLGEDEKKIAVWKQRDKWNVVQQSDKNVVQQKKQCCTTKKKPGGQPGNQNAKDHGAPTGNKNAEGNNGGPPMGNANALTHGLYAKYLPAETLEIAQGIVAISPLDILWGNITIQYAAIVRFQKIMEVESKEELTRHIKTEAETSTTYEFQFAWDRQATFMAAQSKAMMTLNKLIKQYDELCRSELATEEQRLRIEKLKADMEISKERLELDKMRISGGDEEKVYEVMREILGGTKHNLDGGSHD